MAINYATIGTSFITDWWVTSASATGKWTLKAVYSRSGENASKFAAKYKDLPQKSDIKTHTDLAELAADSDVQVVYVASPNSLHYEHAKLMLEAGKHVVLEKPATSTIKELEELFQIAKAQKVYLIEAFRHIQEENFKTIQSSLSKIGEVMGGSLTYASRSSRYDKVLAGEDPPPNIFSLDYRGGSLVDIGVYPVSAAVALLGAPVSAEYKAYKVSTGVDGGGPILLDFDSGSGKAPGIFSVQINQSKIYTSTAPCEIYGEKSTLVFNAVAGIEWVDLIDAKTGKRERLVEGKKAEHVLQEEADEFARIITSKDEKKVAELERLSKVILRVLEGLRKDNGITYPADKV